MKHIFVKQSHTCFKALFGIAFFVFLSLIIIIAIRNNHFDFYWIILTVCVLLLCFFISKILDDFGLYIDDKEIYYKKIKKKPIDITSICAVKIIKAEVDGKFGRRTVRDIHGNTMYTMIFLNDIEESMYNYKYGDTMFLHEYNSYICFYSVLDRCVLEYLTSLNKKIKIIQ